MNWKALGKKVSQYAPVAGTLLAGPAGAKVGVLLASALGVDNAPAAINQAIKSDPEAALKLRQMELDNSQVLAEISLELTRAELGDKANAREQHKHSRMPAVITFLLTLMVSGLLFGIFTDAIPDDNRDMAMMMFGQVFTLWGASVTYWVGTTRSNAEKDRRDAGRQVF